MSFSFAPTNTSHAPPRPKAKRQAITAHEAKRRAMQLLREHRLSSLANKVMDALAVAGVLSDEQIKSLQPLSDRSLVRYYKRHLLDRLPLHTLELGRYGMSCAQVFTLGMVGVEIAELRHGRVPTGYLGFGIHRITHDLLCNETMIQLCRLAHGRHRFPVWRSRFEATVRDDAGRAVLEPDAMLQVEQPFGQWVLEYHNEDYSGRAAQKVERYEETYRTGHWQRSWRTETMPAVLVAFTHRAVATGYQEAVREQASFGLRCTYLGKPWSSIRKGDAPHVWQNFYTGEMVNILEPGGA